MITFKDIKVKIKSEDGNKGVYEISPLPRGYGHTLANSMRRILLSSLQGSAVTSVRINGVDHEYSTIEGLKEDIVELILNLKELKFEVNSDEPQVVTLDVSGESTVTAADLKLPGGVLVVDSKAHIATLTSKSASLSMEIVVERGVGYRAADDSERAELGRIPVDADFTPIISVSFDVGSARKGQNTDLDSITVEIETDGSLKAIDALLGSVKILQEFAGKVMAALGVPVEEVEELADASQEVEEEEVEEEDGVDDEVSSWRIEDLPISKRSKSGLLSGGYETIGDLKELSTTDLLNLPGFGNKSLNEIIDLLSQYGIELTSE